MKKVQLNISVYDFNDYRTFLQSAYDDLHAQNPVVSYRWLQRRAGYSDSSNHFWQKAKGRTPLGQQAAARYARAFGLSPRESQFFMTLAAMNQATRDADRDSLLAQLRQFPEFIRHQTSGRIRYEFYMKWYLPALRALVTLDDFKEDPEWMAKRIEPRITPKQAKEGIALLEKYGFLERDKKGQLNQSEAFIGNYEDRQGDSDIAKLALRNYHRHMIAIAGESIERFSQDRRYIVGNTFALSNSQADRLRNLAADFMRQAEAIVAEDEPIQTMVRLNLQLFPLVREKNSKTKKIGKTERKKK